MNRITVIEKIDDPSPGHRAWSCYRNRNCATGQVMPERGRVVDDQADDVTRERLDVGSSAVRRRLDITTERPLLSTILHSMLAQHVHGRSTVEQDVSHREAMVSHLHHSNPVTGNTIVTSSLPVLAFTNNGITVHGTALLHVASTRLRRMRVGGLRPAGYGWPNHRGMET